MSLTWRALWIGVIALGAGWAQPSRAAEPSVQAAETSVYLGLGAMHTQYGEHVSPGDSEAGYTGAFGIGVSYLSPLRPGLDLYGALNYEFSAGRLDYNGHFRNGTPANGSDSASFNRIEARFGAGFPLAYGIETIPFLAAGYQSWNRAVSANGVNAPGEFYSSPLVGAGLRLDVPVTKMITASGGGEVLALTGGGVSVGGNDLGGFGVTPEERIDLGLDDAMTDHLHVFAKAYWQHFNYAGTKPGYAGNLGYVYEPFSNTTQFGANLGIGYSF